VGFYFRRFLVEELRDLELGWMTYKLFKFIDETRMRGILKSWRCRAVCCLALWKLLVVDTCARFVFLDANTNAHVMSKFYIIFILSTDEFTNRLPCNFARVELI
jgi:hypothetical protein